MVIRNFLLYFSFFFGSSLFAQNFQKEHRVIIALDASLAMSQKWGNTNTEFSTAATFIKQLTDSVYETNDAIEFNLRVYGEQYAAADTNCYDSKQEVVFGKDNRTQIMLRLDNLYPTGISSLPYALKEMAAQDMAKKETYDYDLLIITNTLVACKESICDIYHSRLEGKFVHAPIIITLSDNAALPGEYSCLGNVTVARSQQDLVAIIDTIRNRYKIARKINKDDAAVVKRYAAPAPEKNDTIKIARPAKVTAAAPDATDYDTYLQFTSGFTVSGISLFYQVGDEYAPVNKPDVFNVPMKKQLAKSGRYKVLYNIVNAGKTTNRIKEFYVRLHTNNVVDLY